MNTAVPALPAFVTKSNHGYHGLEVNRQQPKNHFLARLFNMIRDVLRSSSTRL
jgi:hypothetical protein